MAIALWLLQAWGPQETSGARWRRSPSFKLADEGLLQALAASRRLHQAGGVSLTSTTAGNWHQRESASPPVAGLRWMKVGSERKIVTWSRRGTGRSQLLPGSVAGDRSTLRWVHKDQQLGVAPAPPPGDSRLRTQRQGHGSAPRDPPSELAAVVPAYARRIFASAPGTAWACSTRFFGAAPSARYTGENGLADMYQPAPGW